MNLSRHLYEKEEIKASYIVSLLKKENVNESYFWISELFYSFGCEETKKHILKVYYDFYYTENHNMKAWIESTITNEKTILTITKNLLKATYSMDVFKWRLFYESKPLPNVIYRRMPKKIEHYSKKAKRVINAIEKKDLENICGYLVYCSGNEPVVLDEIINHICPEHKVWCRYTNKFHIIISEIVYYIGDAKKEDINYLIEDKLYPFDKIDFSDLSLTRSYKIQHEYIGCFELPRVSLNICTDDIYRNWNVYCYNTPFWYTLFNKHDAKLLNNEVIFVNEANEETFYEHYGYAIDEFPSRLNDDNCFCNIKKINYNDFMRHFM